MATILETLQKQFRTNELGTPQLNDQNRRLHNLPSQMVQRETFIADRIVLMNKRSWDAYRIAKRLDEGQR